MKIIKIECPDSTYSKEERIKLLFENIKSWIYSKEFINLVELFGGNLNPKDSFEYNMNYLIEFTKKWDFRSKIIGTNERWNINNQDYNENSDKILEDIKALGFVEKTIPNSNPDFILPLGGARIANFKRPEYAKEIIDKFNYKNINIVSLSTFRLISEKEKEDKINYSSDIVYEFDAINKGLEKTFNVSVYNEEFSNNKNINLKYCIRTYNNYKENKIYSVAAPSSNPEKRANSRDTFEFFFKKFNIKEKSNLLLITSQIYVTYQFLKFVDLAIENNINIECIGYQMDTNNKININLYLQEIKSTIDAINNLYEKYKDYL